MNSHRIRGSRALISRVLMLIDVAALVTVLADAHDSVRYVIGLLFALLVPGWCVIGLLKLKNPALEFGLTVATSLALIMVFAQIMASINFWHPMGFEVFLSVACLPALAWQAREDRGAPAHSK